MSTLTDYLTSIADAIRNKKGTTSLINAEDFVSEISSIEIDKGSKMPVCRVEYSNLHYNTTSPTYSRHINLEAYVDKYNNNRILIVALTGGAISSYPNVYFSGNTDNSTKSLSLIGNSVYNYTSAEYGLYCYGALYEIGSTLATNEYIDLVYNISKIASATKSVDMTSTSSLVTTTSPIFKRIYNYVENFYFSGTYNTADYINQEYSSLYVNGNGSVIVLIKGGTNTAYENFYFTLSSTVAGVSLIRQTCYKYSSATAGSLWFAILEGIYQPVNIEVSLNSVTSPRVNAVINVTPFNE